MSISVNHSMGVEEIPEGYSNDDLEPADLSVKTKISGSRPSVEEFTEPNNPSFFTSQYTPDDNELSIKAFELAKVQHGKLDAEARKLQDVGTIAMRIFGKLKQEQQAEAARRVKQAVAKKKAQKASKAKAVKTVASPTQHPARRQPTTSPPTEIVMPEEPQPSRLTGFESASAVGDGFESLQIADLGPQPFSPDMQVELQWQERGNSHVIVFDCHWASREPVGRGFQVVCTVDTRWDGSPDLRNLAENPEQTMMLVLKEADGIRGQMEVIQAFYRIKLGVFDQFIFLSP